MGRLPICHWLLLPLLPPAGCEWQLQNIAAGFRCRNVVTMPAACARRFLHGLCGLLSSLMFAMLF